MNRFYVYIWIRKDINAVFYVGKGTKNRYKDLSMRNKYFLNIVNKIGLDNIEIKIIENNLTEEEAFNKEKEYIQYYKDRGIKLANMTSGGEGSSNWYNYLTEEEKEHHKEISKSFLGKKHTEETKNKISQSAKGRTWDDAHKKLFSEMAKGRPSGFKGHKHTDASKVKMREKAIGRPNVRKGKKTSQETKLKISESLKKYAKTHVSPTAKAVVVLDKNNTIINEFNSVKDCTQYYANCDIPISPACVRKYLKTGKTFNSQFDRHKQYIGIRFVYKENLKSQSTIESIDNEKYIIK